MAPARRGGSDEPKADMNRYYIEHGYDAKRRK
jgi:hypothetical protein